MTFQSLIINKNLSSFAVTLRTFVSRMYINFWEKTFSGHYGQIFYGRACVYRLSSQFLVMYMCGRQVENENKHQDLEP